MIYKAKAPLRIGLSGGGTDVSPYCDLYGGVVLNSCINLYAYAYIEPMNNGRIEFHALDRKETIIYENVTNYLEMDDKLDLFKAIYNRITKEFTHNEALSFKLSTFVDAPAGSGLGSSSTLVIAVMKAFDKWLKLYLDDYTLAHLGWEIERLDLQMSGGKQDHYAACFGGFNFMEFYRDDKVVVNQLKIHPDYINELANNLVLYYTGTSRISSHIITDQAKHIENHDERALVATHKLKDQATDMKNALLKGNLHEMGEILNEGWHEKKKISQNISNVFIDEVYEIALKNGALGGKISGAGGGGFMMFYCPNVKKYKVIEALQKLKGTLTKVSFAKYGAENWSCKIKG